MTTKASSVGTENMELMQHSIQFDADTESLSCLCGFAPTGDGTHALTSHLVDTANTDLRSELEATQAQLKQAERELDRQREYGEQLQMSIESCSGRHDLPELDEEGLDDR